MLIQKGVFQEIFRYFKHFFVICVTGFSNILYIDSLFIRHVSTEKRKSDILKNLNVKSIIISRSRYMNPATPKNFFKTISNGSR